MWEVVNVHRMCDKNQTDFKNRIVSTSKIEMAQIYKDNVFHKKKLKNPKTNKPVEVSKVPPFTLFKTQHFNSSQGSFYSNSSLEYGAISDSSISNRMKSINQKPVISLNTKAISDIMSSCSTGRLEKPQIVDNDCTTSSQDNMTYNTQQSTSHDKYRFQERETLKQSEVVVIDISDDEIEECEEDKVVSADIAIIYDGTKYSEENEGECHKEVGEKTKRLQYMEIWQGILAWNIGKDEIFTNCKMKSDIANGNLILNTENWCRNQSLQLLPKCDLGCYVAALEKGLCVTVEMEETFETKQLHNLLADKHTGCISISSSFIENDPLVIILEESSLTYSEVFGKRKLIFKGLIVSASQALAKKISGPLTNTRGWQGTLVWKKRLSNCSLLLIHQVTCSIHIGNTLLEVKPFSWSSTLTMQMFPHSILKYFNGNSIKGVILDMKFFPGEDLEILHYSLSSGLAGCIHVSYDHPSNDQLKVIILTLNRESNKYIGFIPSDQELFCNELKNVIVKYQQKFRGE